MAGEATVTFVGNLGGDPELRFTQSGTAVCSFSVGVAARKKDGEQWKDGETTWYRCNVWRDEAENVAESLGKGDRVIVTGRLENRPYEGREGDKRYSLEVQVDAMGPELRWAQATVRRVQREGGGGGWSDDGGQQRQGQYRQQRGQAPADDPWGSAPPRGGGGYGGGGGGFSDEPPF
jgi:single-strand DNA-binding protein